MSGSIGDNVFRASGVIAAAAAGRTGTVDWQTDSIKTATFTAADAEGYFCNTTGGVFTVNLPAGTAGAIVAVSDYASTWQTNNLTISPNGTDKINGVNNDFTLSTEGFAVSLVYADATRGWKSVTGSDADSTGVAPAWVVAAGGTPSTGTIDGDYKYHAFTATGPLCVSTAGNPDGNDKIDYLVLAGGAAGGAMTYGGGGGGGGYRESIPPGAPWTGSPNALSGGGVTVTATDLTITVGAAGAAAPTIGDSGGDSVFSTITSAGGGGGSGKSPPINGTAGGSGGGGAGNNASSGGAGNTPPVSPPQGFAGGAGNIGTNPGSGGIAGGGGGTGAVGTSTPCPHGDPTPGSAGGAGLTTCISGAPVQRGGGGGGGGNVCSVGGAAGAGGGGKGAPSSAAGTTNLGGGGGGGSHPVAPPAGSSAGGSGLVVVRYKFQN